MGSAAQPRSGTAPKAPAARMPPVLTRNWRRLCRFDAVCFGSPLLPTEALRSFFMPFPPVLAAVQHAVRRFFGIVAPFKIVYNIVFNIIMIEGAVRVMPLVAPGGACPPHRGNYGRKAIQTRDLEPGQIPAGNAIAGARARRHHDCQTPRGGHRAGAAPAERAADRAGSFRPVPDPSR